MVGWVTPACPKKEDATRHPGAHTDSLQYDGGPDWHFWVLVRVWNIGRLSGKGE